MFVRILASFILLGVVATFNVNAASHNAADNGINYTFGELRFVDVKGGDGIEFGGSYRLNAEFYGLASFQDIDSNNNNTEILEIGGGYILPNGKIDFAAEVTIIDADSESGFSLAAGGRGYVAPEIEARVFVKHVDVVDSDTFIELGGDYFVDANISLGITLEVGSNSDTLTFGGRFYF